MLTRGQVARRIGRSIATVRRLEGTKLHPVVNANGVRLFDPSEVSQLAREVATTGRALDGDTPFEGPADDTEDADHEGQLRLQLRELEDQLLDERRKSAQLRRELDEQRRERQRWKADVDEACAAIVTVLDGEFDVLEALDDLIDALDDD